MSLIPAILWGIGQGILTKILCPLRGHDYYLTFESGALFLRCWSCGKRTPGWTITVGKGKTK